MFGVVEHWVLGSHRFVDRSYARGISDGALRISASDGIGFQGGRGMKVA